MASSYRTFANALQIFIDKNFKPLSELIDCRRYSFLIQESPLSRILRNIDYFAYNYALIAFISAAIYLFSNHLLALGVTVTFVFWSCIYSCRHKLSASIPTRMCFNIQMTLLLSANISLMWIFFRFTIAELIGRSLLPIILHAFLFEPVDTPKLIDIPDADAENQKAALENQRKEQVSQQQQHQQNQEQQYQQEAGEFQNSSTEKMSDEMAQAYYQQQQNSQISSPASQDALSHH